MSKHLFKINGVDMPTPAAVDGWKPSLSDVDSSKTTRNARAVLRRERVRQGLYKINIRYNHLPEAEYRKVLNAMKDDFFNVTFYDITTGKPTTKVMYVGDRSWNEYTKGMYTDLSFALVER